MSKFNRDTSSANRMPSLSDLQPIDTSPFKRPSGFIFIWFTIAFVWLISLLPWRVWEPAPNLLLLVLAFWSLHEPRHVNMLAAFVFGLLMDVHDAGLLGTQALSYTLVTYGVLLLGRRLLRFNAIVQTIHLIPVFVLGMAAARFPVAWLVGEWSGWAWLWSALFTVLLWPLADILLLLPQRRSDAVNTSAG